MDDDDYNYDDYEYEDYGGGYSADITPHQSDIIVSDEYELLKESDLKAKRNKQIKEFMEFSSLSKEEAEIVLINYNWNMEKLTSEWYENTEGIKVKCGIEEKITSKEKMKELKEAKNTSYCLVCFDEFSNEVPKIGLKCGHFLCKSCYEEYLTNKINTDPLLVVATPCPQIGCNLLVTHSIFKEVLKGKEDIKKKYESFLLKNFSDSNSDIKNCPNPKCEIVSRVPGHVSKEIRCICGTVYCFKCLKESHRPVDCEMAEIWEKKNNDSGVNDLWLSSYTKQCPKCKKHIEKNQGCKIFLLIFP
ncbi:MAG: hypothetical protein MJ252_27590 [archaeon]|nr:hypothetical protein [archaeon]